MGLGFEADTYAWDINEDNIDLNNYIYHSAYHHIDVHNMFKESTENYRKADVIIFTNGSDPDPRLSGQNHHYTNSVNTARDKSEYDLYLNTVDKPKIGIGRGALFLGIMNGAKVIQNIKGATLDCTMQTNNQESYFVHTYKSSCLDLTLNKNANVLAWTIRAKNKDCYEGTHPTFKVDGDVIKEPLITYFEETKSLCINYDPFFKANAPALNEYTEQLIFDLIENYL